MCTLTHKYPHVHICVQRYPFAYMRRLPFFTMRLRTVILSKKCDVPAKGNLSPEIYSQQREVYALIVSYVRLR